MAKKRLKRKLDVKGKKGRSRGSKRRYQSNALQKRLNKSHERSKTGVKSVIKGDAPMWSPKDGSHIIDIIPYEAGKYDPLTDKGDPTYTLELHVHRNVGPDNQIFLCLEKMYGKECPICEHRAKLFDKGKDDAASKLWPKKRNVYNVVCYDRGEEKKGVQIWDISFHYSEKHLLALSKRPMRGGKKTRTINFADEEEGKSVSFTIEPAKSKNDYPSYVGWTFDDRDYEIDEDILDAAYCLDEMLHIPKYKEVEKAFFAGDSKTGGSDEDDDDDSELSELLEELEDLDEMDELEDFIDEHDLKVKIKKKYDVDDVKELIEDALRENYDVEEDEPAYTKKQINKMKKKQLKAVIKEEDLDIDNDDWDELEELRELVIEELEL